MGCIGPHATQKRSGISRSSSIGADIDDPGKTKPGVPPNGGVTEPLATGGSAELQQQPLGVSCREASDFRLGAASEISAALGVRNSSSGLGATASEQREARCELRSGRLDLVTWNRFQFLPNQLQASSGNSASPPFIACVRRPAGPVSQCKAEPGRTRTSAGTELTSTNRVLLQDTRRLISARNPPGRGVSAAAVAADCGRSVSGGRERAGAAARSSVPSVLFA